MPCRSDFDNDYDVFLCFNNEGNFLHWPHPGRGARRYLWTNSKSAGCTALLIDAGRSLGSASPLAATVSGAERCGVSADRSTGYTR